MAEVTTGTQFGALDEVHGEALSDEELALAFQALSNPNRLSIYREILRHERHDVGPNDDAGCLVYDFINKLDIGAPTVSHHVKKLVRARLIRVERNGKFLTCYLNAPVRDAMAALLGDVSNKSSIKS